MLSNLYRIEIDWKDDNIIEYNDPKHSSTISKSSMD